MERTDIVNLLQSAINEGAKASDIVMALSSVVVNLAHGEYGERAAELLLAARTELQRAEAEARREVNRYGHRSSRTDG